MRRVALRPALGLFGLLLAAGCSEPSDGSTSRPSASDATAAEAQAQAPSEVVLVGAAGDTLRLASPPRRIVSLIPGVNRILVELGGRDRIVARTEYDTLSVLADLPSVGGGIGPNLETLIAVGPDLVIRFEGAQDARTADRLDDLGIPHLGVRPDGIDDLRSILITMGAALERQESAAAMVSEIDRGLEGVRDAVAPFPGLRVAWLLGGTPPLAAGPGTFLQELIDVAGGTNVFQDLAELYTPVSLETVLRRRIDVIVVGEGVDPDSRITEGRRVVRVPSHVQIPGPDIVDSAWEVALALHPGLIRPRGGA